MRQDNQTQEAPRVSVVMIFLDAARFIEEAIQSVFAQTYERWELLLVDDGSTDESTRLAKHYVERHPDRVRYLEHPGHRNLGMSASRNLGIRHARGEFIALLDADDVYLPMKLEHQVGLLETHPDVDMVYGVTEYWHSWRGAAEDRKKNRPRNTGLPAGIVLPAGALLSPIVKEIARTPCICGVVMRKSAIEAVGGFETTFKGMFEDQVFFIKMFAATRVLVDDRCLDRYRQHPDSCCSLEFGVGQRGRDDVLSPSRQAFLEWLEEFLGRTEIRDRSIKRRITRELLIYRYPKLMPVWKALAPWRHLRNRLNRRRRKTRSSPSVVEREVDPSSKANFEAS
jgi:glycosyltransferase involved in cell wall biosynthesis